MLETIAKRHSLSRSMVVELLIREADKQGGAPLFREAAQMVTRD
jgi:hypothetical protein